MTTAIDAEESGLLNLMKIGWFDGSMGSMNI
jgi:hypothetical protein